MDSPSLRPLPIVTAASVRNTCGDAHHTGDAVAIEGSALPFRFDARIATQEEIERANTAHELQGDSRFQPVEEALAEIHLNPAGQTVARLMSWVHHPDERVAIAAVKAMDRYQSGGADPRIVKCALAECAARGCRDAATASTLWTPLLDACGDTAGVGRYATAIEVLDTQRDHVDNWVRTRGTPYVAERLLRYADTAIRLSVVWGLPAFDESLAARIVTQEDAHELCIEPPIPLYTRAKIGVLPLEKRRLLLQNAVKIVCDAALNGGVDEEELFTTVLILVLLDSTGLRFAPDEITALFACIPVLTARGMHTACLEIWNVLSRCPELSAAQVTELYLLGARLPPAHDGWRIDLFSLLAHPHAPADFVRGVAITLRGKPWRDAAEYIARHRAVAADPVIRSRLRRSRNPLVLANLCRSVRGDEFAQLFRRMFEGCRPKNLWRPVNAALTLLEDDPSRLEWLRPEDLTPLYESPCEDDRVRAILLVGTRQGSGE